LLAAEQKCSASVQFSSKLHSTTKYWQKFHMLICETRRYRSNTVSDFWITLDK